MDRQARRAGIGPLVVTAIAAALGGGCSVVRPQPDKGVLDVATWPRDCPVHKAPLEVAVEPVSHGTPPPVDPAYAEARARDFPYAMTHMYATHGQEAEWRAHYCPSCRAVESHWERDHGRTIEGPVQAVPADGTAPAPAGDPRTAGSSWHEKAFNYLFDNL
ncbi:MAG TPA: hypothetical protein VG406_04335 [Isosphaeraceae bacterium]|jgi:hypothetical protein|nr:hypothetical protein [Isosphaeraceae bacterium]